MDAVSTYEILVNFQETTQRNIPEDGHLRIPSHPQKLFISSSPIINTLPVKPTLFKLKYFNPINTK
jgi:hypothetical protein